jgi:hypothetical protein
MAFLTRGRCGELSHVDVAGVQRRGQPTDRPALTGGVPSLEHDAQGRPEFAVADLAARLEAEREESSLSRLQTLEALGLRELLGQIRVI